MKPLCIPPKSSFSSSTPKTMRLKKDCSRHHFPLVGRGTLFLQPDGWKGIRVLSPTQIVPGQGQGPITRPCRSCSQLRVNTDSIRLQSLGTLFPKDLFCKTTPYHVPAVPYRPSQNPGCAGYSRHSVATTMGGTEAMPAPSGLKDQPLLRPVNSAPSRHSPPSASGLPKQCCCR